MHNVHVRIGDLGCSGIDVDGWQRANRCPLFPGKIQEWVLVTSRDDADIESGLKTALNSWFGGFGAAQWDTLKIERTARERLNAPNRLKRREDLSVGPPPTVTTTSPTWVSISFAYRGTLTDIPWPCFTNALLPGAVICPVGADWILDNVGAASAAPAPPAPSVFDDVEDAGKKTLKAIALPLLAVAGILGLVIYARRSQ